uniref:Putative ribonuclease H-like domain-containing protein n=1 Tax=Tanacetum cinerariifolium TaxID=118510 RepID=A0A6L2M6J4_TANCI|nr:putative ribonuclease H-like domain-containing protein [Tanacetum cinerariifolium]
MEEIDLTFTPDDPMPPSIEEDDDDSRDTLIREKLLDNYSLPIPENESFHFDIPSFLVLLQNHQMEKSPDLLSHRGFENFQPSAECPMKIHGKNIPTLDVPHSYRRILSSKSSFPQLQLGIIGHWRNVPRPSHGDISCSGSGTRGVEQMLLDDHHIDDDDEGVELTEPCVKPSNAIRSNILNPLPDPIERPMIIPSADDEPWATWESVTTSKERPDVARFKESYQWDSRIEEDDHHINDDDEGVELTQPGVKPSNAIRKNTGSTCVVEKMLLDDHHVDDDDEGVELTEPGVNPSNAIRSNIELLNAGSTRAIRLDEVSGSTSNVKRSGAANGSAGGNKAAMEKKGSMELVSRGKWANWVKQASRLRSINWGCFLCYGNRNGIVTEIVTKPLRLDFVAYPLQMVLCNGFATDSYSSISPFVL